MKYLIDFFNTVADSDIQAYLSNNGCVVLKEWDNFEKTFLVEVESPLTKTEIVDRLVEEVPLKIKPLDFHPHHVNGETNPYWMTHADPTKPKIEIDTQADKDWWKNYTFINPNFSEEKYSICRVGQNINVYLMDSGIEANHPEFSEASIVNLYTVTPDDFGDNKGHGTALASLIVGKTCGITNATVKNVKIYDANHETLQSEFLDALDSVINDHVVGTHSVLNCSWVIEKNEWVEHKLRILFSRGVSILAAAGNQGVSIEDVTPASMPEALTVGAYNKDLLPCNFSNYTGTSVISLTNNSSNHGELDGWAPGEEVYVAALNGAYGFASGTSLATAISSAVLASNLSWFVDSNGVPYPLYSEYSFSSLDAAGSGLVFNKTGLLDLSDEKYSSSKNIIANILDRSKAMHMAQRSDHITARVVATNDDSQKIIGNLYNPNVTKKIEWVTALPDNFILLADGKLVTKPSSVVAPAAGQVYSLVATGTFNRTNLDDSVDLVTVDVYSLEENIDTNNLPQDDEVINILLQNSACTGGSIGTCVASLPAPTICEDFCSGGAYCCNACDVTKIAYHPCVCGFCA